MPLIKTATLVPPALDWAVAKSLGATRIQPYEYNGRGFLRVSLAGGVHAPWEPSRYWNQGGPIIEREWLDITSWPNESDEEQRWQCHQYDAPKPYQALGPTPLIAAMRCFVASKFGDAIDVPEELL